MGLSTYQCRDCGEEYTDHRGDHCPECGGANVILLPKDYDPPTRLEGYTAIQCGGCSEIFVATAIEDVSECPYCGGEVLAATYENYSVVQE